VSSAPLEAARALGPLIRASAAETDAQRELPRPLFEAMADVYTAMARTHLASEDPEELPPDLALESVLEQLAERP